MTYRTQIRPRQIRLKSIFQKPRMIRAKHRMCIIHAEGAGKQYASLFAVIASVVIPIDKLYVKVIVAKMREPDLVLILVFQ